MNRSLVAFLSALCLAAVPHLCPAAEKYPLVVKSDSVIGTFTDAKLLCDGKPKSEMIIDRPNDQVTVIFDLGEPKEISAITITGGAKPAPFLWAAAVSPDQERYRDVLYRYVNLSMGEPHVVTSVPLTRSAIGRYVRLVFRAAHEGEGVAEVAFVTKPNRPDRHLMWWGNPHRLGDDLVKKMDFFANDLQLTDIWLDFIDTAFPQSNLNAGLDTLAASGAIDQMKKRGIRYWLSEHESMGTLVNSPEDLRDDFRFNAVTTRMRELYSKAKSLGFTGIVFDAEDYDKADPAAVEKYKDIVDHVDMWTFKDEFGYAGHYYHRGLEIGRAIKESHGGPLLQVYEARMYAGTPGGRDGNHWFLKGIHDAGVEVWVATEKTYGAGETEITFPDISEHLNRWFVQTTDHVFNTYKAFPYATRVLPGFHPWNSRLKTPLYLPKYLDQQLTNTEGAAPGCWLYFEGNALGGDPRQAVPAATMKKYGVTAEEYLKVLRSHPTNREDSTTAAAAGQ